MSKEVVIYYRKDPSWMATSFLYPPDPESPDCLVEVHRSSHSRKGKDFLKWGDVAILEDVWCSMQGIETGDLCDKLQVRSMMVGDVIVVEKTAYQCEAIGWKELDAPWLHEGSSVAPPHVFPVLGLTHAEDSEEDATSS